MSVPDDLQALRGSMNEALSAEGTLTNLNNAGWFLVRSNQIKDAEDYGPRYVKFTNEELDMIQAWAREHYHDQVGELRVRMSDNNYHELEGPAAEISRAHSVVEKINAYYKR